ncbi:MAG: hypothetical protein JRI23_02565 [Deltaproteobacteria bacterium]|jgi:hypothetical protein|nr:hypothetical protein [Deltaproteobacteria bacterium]MBW2530378.1 hypothetical protein [Deltaproteobacteria bacterium]
MGTPSRLRNFPALRLLAAALLASVVGLVSWSGPASAQTDEDDRLAAQALFDEAQKLKKRGDFEAACEKFAASQKLDPALGTQLNLADCYERIGKTASAWINYVEVASRARQEKQGKRARIAKLRADKLKDKLCHLRIDVLESVEDLEVERDGKVVPEATWGTPTPVDPGSHEVTASAPGKKPWSTTVEVEGEGSEVTVEIPALEDAPIEDDGGEGGGAADGGGDDVGPDEAQSDGSGQLIAGIAIGVVGLGGVGLGAAFAGIAHSKYGESQDFCDPADDSLCSQEGVDLREEAQTAQAVYIAGFAVGGAALITGIILLATLPSDDAPEDDSVTGSFRLVPAVGPNGAAMQLTGRW